MDPLSLSAGVTGFLNLALDVAKILNDYVDGVKSALEETRKLFTEFTDFLRSEDAKGNDFKETSMLCTAIAGCQAQIEGLYKRFDKLLGNANRSKMARLYNQFKWPFHKDKCQKTIDSLHRFALTFEFSLVMENWFVSFSSSP